MEKHIRWKRWPKNWAYLLQNRKFEIVFEESARKEISKLERVTKRRVVARIEGLCEDPRPVGCLKLSGEHNIWRIRVGDYRIAYSINDDKIFVLVLTVRKRDEVYKKLGR
ncbi:MAG: type II toxin-antitoxin system RelE family toxin [Micrococcales bacterium]